MNLRILKKLSKRAAPLLAKLGDDRDQFRARHPNKDSCHIGIRINDRKHWERGWSAHNTIIFDEIKWPARDGKGWLYMRPPSSPRKGTIMVGSMRGYYEPEWEEQSAYEALLDLMHSAAFECCEHEPDPDDGYSSVMALDLSTPAKLFKAAQELIAQKEGA